MPMFYMMVGLPGSGKSFTAESIPMLKPKVVPKVISAIPKPCGGRVRAKDQMAIMRVFLTPLLVWEKIIWHFFIIASEVMILPKRISPIGLNLWTENTPNPSVFTK